MDEVLRWEGRTILFVSDNLAAIAQIAHRALLLDAGSLAIDGSATKVPSTYSRKVPGPPGTPVPLINVKAPTSLKSSYRPLISMGSKGLGRKFCYPHMVGQGKTALRFVRGCPGLIKKSAVADTGSDSGQIRSLSPGLPRARVACTQAYLTAPTTSQNIRPCGGLSRL